MIRSLMKIYIVLLAVTAAALFPAAAAEKPVPEIFKSDAKIFRDYGLKTEPVELKIPGLKREYTFVWLSDLHVIADDISEVAPKSQRVMAFRRDKRFNNPQSGKNPAALWRVLPGFLNRSSIDAVFLGGDICDMGSAANLELLRQGFKQFKKPYIFLREDHDFTPWHLASKDMTKQQKISKAIDGHPALPYIEYEDLIVVGLDYSVRRIRPKELKLFKKLYAKGKPMIMLMHVPIAPLNKKDWQWITPKRSVWGASKGIKYTMIEFVDMITAQGGPVKLVLSGHLHRRWSGNIAPGVHQHIFSPAFEGYLGVIKLVPDQNQKK